MRALLSLKEKAFSIIFETKDFLIKKWKRIKPYEQRLKKLLLNERNHLKICKVSNHFRY